MLNIKLAKREKRIIIIAAYIILAFILILLVISFFKKRDLLKKDIIKKEEEFQQITSLITELQDYQKRSKNMGGIIAKRGKEFTLASYLDNAAKVTGVKASTKMLPSSSDKSSPYEESKAVITLQEISPEQLVNFLYNIENKEEFIFVMKIVISDNKKSEGYLDSEIRVQTYQLKE